MSYKIDWQYSAWCPENMESVLVRTEEKQLNTRCGKVCFLSVPAIHSDNQSHSNYESS